MEVELERNQAEMEKQAARDRKRRVTALFWAAKFCAANMYSVRRNARMERKLDERPEEGWCAPPCFNTEISVRTRVCLSLASLSFVSRDELERRKAEQEEAAARHQERVAKEQAEADAAAKARAAAAKKAADAAAAAAAAETARQHV